MTPTPTLLTQDVAVYQNAVPAHILAQLDTFIATQTHCRTNYTCWHEGIIKGSNAVLVHDLPETLSQDIFTAIRVKAPELDKFAYLHAMYYKWMPGSYIPWHADHAWEVAVTIYCNPEWDQDWGGYFAYKTATGITCIKPEFNTAVRINTPLEHAVFSTTPDAKPRTTIQVFGRYAK